MEEKKIRQRNEIPRSDQWDLAPLYDSDDAWEKEFSEAEDALSGYETYRGRLGDAADIFFEAVALDLSISRKVEKLYTYAHLKNDEDKANDRYMGMFQRTVSLYTRAAEAGSFLKPEVQALSDEVIAAYRQDERMVPYRFFLEKILRTKLHTLDAGTERILAMSQEIAQAPGQVFGQLNNVDLKFGVLEDDAGNRVELSHGNFVSFLSRPDRNLREKAFFQYYRAYEDHKYTIAATLSHSLKKDLFYSRVRQFENCRSGALFADNMPESVYDNLLETVKANLSPLFGYLGFRQRALGLDDLHFYDTYVPIVKTIDFHMPYDEAVDTCVEALAPLGQAYTGILGEGLSGGWVDRYENRGKRSGAYSSGCYDSPPYILMNYEPDTINSLYTLIHEAGHSMHSWYARKHQPYVDHDYTIFVAEVASTFNEILLGRHLLKRYADDPAMKAYIVNREIDNLRATLFRQTMFAEFEKITHGIVEQNEPLTLEVLTRTYNGLLKTYFGDAMVIDDALKLECLRIPHFYSAFYVYKYATGVSAAIALANRVLEGGDGARDDYIGFLKLGGSLWPLEELDAAGVDMRSPGPVKAAIDHFASLVEQLESEYTAA